VVVLNEGGTNFANVFGYNYYFAQIKNERCCFKFRLIELLRMFVVTSSVFLYNYYFAQIKNGRGCFKSDGPSFRKYFCERLLFLPITIISLK